MKKTRVSFFIDEKLVSALDAQVARGDADSRSSALEQVLRKQLAPLKQAVILAGGKAQQLLVPEAGVFRPLLKIGGKTLVERMVQKLRDSGYFEIAIVGSSEVITKIFEKLKDGEGLGVKITYIEEKEHLGSSHTLALAKEKMRGRFLFLVCDHYFDFDLAQLEKDHESNLSGATLAIYAGANFTWRKSSLVQMNGNRIVSYDANPKSVSTNLVSTGIGIAEPEIFEYVKKAHSLFSQVFPEMAEKGRLAGHIVEGEFVNVHTLADAKQAEKIAGNRQ
ncbi:UTP--glucose-1-phosphate uridylyltransferase AglF [Candidatus Gugararchaeum adminiculabundum]|nr:UTP--glucose-1-phosphate uridylyltransferase AglF [Candidatus Gugararchaeum adminiculabundum]